MKVGIKHFIQATWKIFLVVLILYTLSISYFTYSQGEQWTIRDKIMLYVVSSTEFDSFSQLLVTLPFTWFIYSLQKNGFFKEVFTRVDAKRYLAGLLVGAMISTFLLVFISNVITIILSVSTVQLVKLPKPSEYLDGYLFGQAQKNAPILFGFFWSAFKGLTLQFYTIMGFLLALTQNNPFIIYATPFVFTVMDMYLSSTFHLTPYAIDTLYTLNVLTAGKTTILSIFLTLIKCILILMLLYWIVRHKMPHREELDYAKN